jgi:hypothetical protein
VGKPGVAGAHTTQRLNLSKPWEGSRMIGQCLEPDPGNLAVRECVQLRLVCSAGGRPAGAKVRRPVVRIAGWRDNQNPEAYRQGLPWGDYELPGRNDSERKCGLEKSRSEGRAHFRRAKAAWGAES